MTAFIIVLIVIFFILAYPSQFGKNENQQLDEKMGAFVSAFGLLITIALAFLIIILKLLETFGMIKILI